MVLKLCSCYRERDIEAIFQWAGMWDFSEIKGRKFNLYPSRPSYHPTLTHETSVTDYSDFRVFFRAFKQFESRLWCDVKVKGG